ncbi:MAG: pantoate--beta-alanine ligase, partial [Planctomycetota bacterium]
MKTLADVETLLAEARSRSSPTVTFVSGVFNVLHPGHLRLLRFAKEQGDILVVGVYSDRLALDPQIKLPERIEGVEALAWVDHAFDLDQPHPEVLLRLRPDLVIKGKEWGDKPNVEEEVLRQYGGRLLFSSGEFTFSAVDLMREEFKQRTAFAPSADHDYLRRRGITSATLQEAIGRFEELNVLVLGDTIIDEYIFCDAL